MSEKKTAIVDKKVASNAGKLRQHFKIISTVRELIINVERKLNIPYFFIGVLRYGKFYLKNFKSGMCSTSSLDKYKI